MVRKKKLSKNVLNVLGFSECPSGFEELEGYNSIAGYPVCVSCLSETPEVPSWPGALAVCSDLDSFMVRPKDMEDAILIAEKCDLGTKGVWTGFVKFPGEDETDKNSYREYESGLPVTDSAWALNEPSNGYSEFTNF